MSRFLLWYSFGRSYERNESIIGHPLETAKLLGTTGWTEVRMDSDWRRNNGKLSARSRVQARDLI